jgi:hypothetical protein
MSLHFTENGWMDKFTFGEIICKSLLTEIEETREMLGPEEEKGAMILCDGHSSRMNLPLMRELAKRHVDVGILPSHSSSVTQPLDLCPNAQFKSALAKSKPCFPQPSKMNTDLKQFIDQIQDAAEFALLRPNVKKGWERCGLIWGEMENMLRTLDYRPPSYPVVAPSKRFTISGQWITSPEFLEQWDIHESRRGSRHERRTKRRIKECEFVSFQRKRRKIERDDIDDSEDEVKNDVVEKKDSKMVEEGLKRSTAGEKKRGRKQTHRRDSSEESTEETTTDSEMRDGSAPLNPIHLRVEQQEGESSEVLSTSELQELRRFILEERIIHPHARQRKPIRPFSPELILTKKKRTAKDLQDDDETWETYKEAEKTDGRILDEAEQQQLDLLNMEKDEDEENVASDSEYHE